MSQPAPDALTAAGRPRLRARRAEPEAPRTHRQTARVLGAVPLFLGFGRRHLERLARESDEQRFAPGAVVVTEGDLGEALYVVLSGEARVIRRGRTVARMYPGDFFGELSAIDGGPRTATVQADTDLVVVRLFRRTLVRLLRDEPNLTIKLIEGIVRRIRQQSHPSFG